MMMLDNQTPAMAQRTNSSIISAAQAIVKARELFPDLSGDGIRLYPGSTPQQIHADQIETAMAFLKLLRPTKRPTIDSGTLKHHCEDWGSVTGLSSHVSRGALTVAAIALGLSVRAYPNGPHVAIGVSLSDLRPVNAETLERRIARRERLSHN
jgi:hypothetical protein